MQLFVISQIVTGGNQRDLARAKNQKKQIEAQKKKSAADKTGMSVTERKFRQVMKEERVMMGYLPINIFVLRSSIVENLNKVSEP